MSAWAARDSRHNARTHALNREAAAASRGAMLERYRDPMANVVIKVSASRSGDATPEQRKASAMPPANGHPRRARGQMRRASMRNTPQTSM